MRNTLDRDFFAMGYLSARPASQGVGHDTGTHLSVWTGAVPVLYGATVLPQLICLRPATRLRLALVDFFIPNDSQPANSLAAQILC
jgi:hypothetical protein